MVDPNTVITTICTVIMTGTAVVAVILQAKSQKKDKQNKQ